MLVRSRVRSPASAVRVDALGEVGVEAGVELDDHAVWVVEGDVMMVGHHLRKHDLNAEARGSLDEAIEERVVHLVVGAHEEHALHASASKEPELAGGDRSRQRHMPIHSKGTASIAAM